MTEETTAFANAMIFDGSSAELREGCVRVAAGTIAEVAEGPGPGDRVVDCRGRTVVPGLIDAHFHAYGARLSLLEIETSLLSYLALAGARRLAGALGRGFTTVRDPGGGDAGLAQAIREGLTAAPRYLFCGAALSQTGGHGDPRPPELGCCLGGGHMAEVVDGVDALRRAARERLRSGAHAIKIMASGGVISPSDPLRVPQYSPEEIRVVAEEAARRGSYVAAHAYSAEAIAVAVANGVRSIEHGNLLDAPAAALMAERDAFLVPTLVTYDAMERRGAELGLAPVAQAKNREVLDAGGTFVADDAGSLTLPDTSVPADVLRTDFLPYGSPRWFAVVDARGRVAWTHKGDEETSLLVIASHSTPLPYLAVLRQERIPYLIAGARQVDLGAALAKIRTQLGARCLVSQAGGGLNGALLRAGLVDELHIITVPALIGGLGTPSVMDGPPLGTGSFPEQLRTVDVQVGAHGTIWAHYEVVARCSAP